MARYVNTPEAGIAVCDAVNVTAASVLVAALVARSVLSAAELGMVPFALGLVLGFVAADIASGLVTTSSTESASRAPSRHSGVAEDEKRKRVKRRKYLMRNGDPGAIRTRDPQLRRLVLYPG